MIPVLGALLIVPPLLSLFAAPYRIFGVPLEMIYLFTVWVVMILGAVLASRHLPRSELSHHDGDPKGNG